MIFITGCNGLVGSFIARRLVLNGEQLLALRRRDSDMSLLKDIENSIEWIEGDVSDTEILNKAMEKCETVIHAAAIISFSSSKRDLMYNVNVEGTSNVVNAALKNKIKKFCYISSIAAIGRKKDELIINESTLWEDSEMNTHYAKSKHLAELEVWRGIEEGLPAFILNPSVVLGPGNWNNGSTKLFNYIIKRNRFYTNGFISYVDVDDVAEITTALLIKGIVGERYILNAGHVTYKELFNSIARSFGVTAPSIEVGKFLSEIAWRFERIRSIFSASEPIITKETVKLSGFSFEYENTKIATLLNYKFCSLDETTKKTCDKLLYNNVNK